MKTYPLIAETIESNPINYEMWLYYSRKVTMAEDIVMICSEMLLYERAVRKHDLLGVVCSF